VSLLKKEKEAQKKAAKVHNANLMEESSKSSYLPSREGYMVSLLERE